MTFALWRRVNVARERTRTPLVDGDSDRRQVGQSTQAPAALAALAAPAAAARPALAEVMMMVTTTTTTRHVRRRMMLLLAMAITACAGNSKGGEASAVRDGGMEYLPDCGPAYYKDTGGFFLIDGGPCRWTLPPGAQADDRLR